MNKLKVAGYLLRYFGPGWLAFRLGYALRMRTGWLRRQFPATSWEEQPLETFLSDPALADPQAYLEWRKEHAPKFFFRPSDRQVFQPYFAGWDQEGVSPMGEADDLPQGHFRYFRNTIAQAGWPPGWHCNPFTGQSTPADQHWSQIDDFGYGDIKVIWDLSRFGFVYALVRAYWRTGDDRYAERFWQLVEDWRVHNPPQQGANWKCGQETSFRVMAWCFGLYGFLDSPATTAQRVSMLAQMVAVSGMRIEANLHHALSQQNNHGVSEGMGLWTIGALFPELHAASRWEQKGRAVLEDLGCSLIYEDGSFAQHSANYQRLVLQNYLWALRLGDLYGRPFSEDLLQRIRIAGEFLYQIQDEVTGCLPCFGHNDGSLILPLDNCDYQDYRPVIQAVSYLTTQTRHYSDGPWDESLLWLFGLQALQAPVNTPERVDLQAAQGGYYTLRTKQGFAFTHCAAFHHRPAHADILNVDIWWQGQNMILDPGTYSYNAPPPWDHSLSRTIYHNAITVDGLDQMERVSRFLWLPWVKGTMLEYKRSPDKMIYIASEHDGYNHLSHPVKVYRNIQLVGEDRWLILDYLKSDQVHIYQIQWLLPDLLYVWDDQKAQLVLGTPAGKYLVSMYAFGQSFYSLAKADPVSPRGWQSPYYNACEPALSLSCTAKAKNLAFWTLLGPAPDQLATENNAAQVESEKWRIQWKL